MKPTKGGKRPNAGAKPKYKEPTKTVAFRIPLSLETEIKELVKQRLSKELADKK